MKDEAKFAVVIREAQNELDDFAFRLPRCAHLTPIAKLECMQLANNLERLAQLVRNFDPDSGYVDWQNLGQPAGPTPKQGEQSS